LARTGRNKYPTYRIVAAESARAATGKFIEVLGNYNPHTKALALKKDRIAERMSFGAQPSNTVVKLLLREKMELPSWVKLKTKTAPKAGEPEVKEAETTEVTPEEAEADAEGTDGTEVVEEPRVAEVAEETASEAEDKAGSASEVETAANAPEAK
jgi:small subunit ribosomal protein S16